MATIETVVTVVTVDRAGVEISNERQAKRTSTVLVSGEFCCECCQYCIRMMLSSKTH